MFISFRINFSFPQRQTFWLSLWQTSNCPLTDLEDLFLQAGIGQKSLGLTRQQLSKVFGTLTPSTEAMACFDSDGDQRYSLTELQAAVGVWAR